ncbi:MAG: HAMP domain-containing protein [Syntrophaceae bacterium]|nr:HAMP domain-containing protein [Syntrophaceae bacterium]
MKNRLFLRILATYLVIVLLTFGMVYLILSRQIREIAVERNEATLTAYARIIDLESREQVIRRVGMLAEITGARVTVVDAAGKVLAESATQSEIRETHLHRPEFQEARLRGKGRAVRYSQTLGVDMLYVAFPIRGTDGESGFVRLALPLTEVRTSLKNLQESLLITGLLALSASLLFAAVFSWRFASPIREMEIFTERLRRGETTGTLIVRGPDEVRLLGENINHLVEELRGQVAELREERAKLIATFAGMSEGVMLLDAAGRIEGYNRAFRSMISDRYGDVTGQSLMEAFRNVDLQNLFDEFRKTNKPMTGELMLGQPRSLVLDVSIDPVSGDPGEEKAVFVFHDVTRMKRLEQMRIDFVANMAHEIRTPLTAILGFVETLRSGAVEEPEQSDRFLAIIEEQARRLSRLLDDLLTLSNIELGETRFSFEEVPLDEALDQVLPVLEERIRQKRIALEREIPPDLSPLRADRDRLVQALLNVLDNAVKFTPEDGKIGIVAETDAAGWSIIRISDTGIGIPEGEINRIGERFYRVDRTRSREMGGTGLGLSIVKHILAAHGGFMLIDSRLGRGTTVSLRFPPALQI